MWFIVILFLIIGAIGVAVRSTKTLWVLAILFSFIAMFYTPWWPIVFFLISGVAVIVYLDNKEAKLAQEEEWKQNISREIQDEVEMRDLLNRMEKAERKK